MNLLPVSLFYRALSETTRYERVGVLLHREDGSIIGGSILDQGCQDRVEIDLRALAALVLDNCSSGITLAHSHPHSDDPKPSRTDISTTQKVHEIFSMLGAPVRDHFIFGRGGKHVFVFSKQGVAWQ